MKGNSKDPQQSWNVVQDVAVCFPDVGQTKTEKSQLPVDMGRDSYVPQATSLQVLSTGIAFTLTLRAKTLYITYQTNFPVHFRSKLARNLSWSQRKGKSKVSLVLDAGVSSASPNSHDFSNSTLMPNTRRIACD